MSLPNHLDHIHDGLYIGNAHASRTEQILRDNQISVSVNVAKDLDDPWFSNIIPLKFGLVDGKSEENNYQIYLQAAKTILSFLDTGHSVLVHCHEGRSRSPAISTLVIAKRLSLGLPEAFQLIQERRPGIYIHPGHTPFLIKAWRKWCQEESLTNLLNQSTTF